MTSLTPVDFDPFASDQSANADAISSIESGGKYHLVGPMILQGSMRGQRALGKYQVMESNVGPWTEEALGKRLAPGQFLASPEAQEAVFKHKFGQYVQKYGPEGAARAWFAGEGGMNDPNRRDQLGTSVASYGQKFSQNLASKQTKLVPIDFDPFAEKPTGDNFATRFGAADCGERGDMQSAMTQRAAEMMRGPATTPAQNMAITENSVLPAVEQGTNPNISAYGGRLVSNKVEMTDTGQIGYKDPQDGTFKLYDPKTQVYLTDPADNTVKIFSRSDDTNENPAVGIARALAPGLASGAPTARAAGLVTQRGIKPGIVNSGDVLKSATPHYQEFDAAAKAIPVNSQPVIDRIKNSIRAVQNEQNTKAVFNTIDDLPETYNLYDLQQLKVKLGKNYANSADSQIRGASKAASDEISKIVGEIATSWGESGAAAALKTGDQITAAGKTLEKVNQLENVAETTAAGRRFGQSANEVLRGFFTNIIKKMESTRKPDFNGTFMGFKPDELDAMREISQGRNVAERGVRTAAALAPEKGIMRAAVESGALLHSGGATLALPAIGVAGDILSRILDARQVNRLKDLIAKRSPAYSDAVSNAVIRLQSAQGELSNNPTPAAFGAFVSSARQLSSGLTRDGIKISSGDLIRLLEGPAKSAAEPDQQEIPGYPPQ